MSRITKQIAEDVSKAMTAEKRKAATELEIAFKDEVRKTALSRLPKKVIELFESEFKPYMKRTGYAKLCGNGFNYNTVYFSDIPTNDNNSLVLTEEEGEKLSKMEWSYKNSKDEVKKLEEKIFNALYFTLKSYKNVEAHFPEAYEHLPKLSTSTALTINLDKLRQEIK